MKRYLFLSFQSLLAIMFFVAVPGNANAQNRDRNYIKDCIRKYGECRNVAITKYNGDLMLYGQNGWAASGCPKDLTNALRELHDDNEYIDDVQLTENGRWLILYGDNGLQWNDIPYDLEQQLREWNREQEVITSVSFNDSGDWIAVSKGYIAASSPEIQDFVAEGMEDHGGVWATCVTEDAIVVVYEEGYRTFGEVPDSLVDALKETSINVYRLKIAGSSWFFSDGVSKYNYRM